VSERPQTALMVATRDRLVINRAFRSTGDWSCPSASFVASDQSVNISSTRSATSRSVYWHAESRRNLKRLEQDSSDAEKVASPNIRCMALEQLSPTRGTRRADRSWYPTRCQYTIGGPLILKKFAAFLLLGQRRWDIVLHIARPDVDVAGRDLSDGLRRAVRRMPRQPARASPDAASNADLKKVRCFVVRDSQPRCSVCCIGS
jgi:hypothetical protein